MQLYLIRHGETDWNRLGLYQGTTDVALNARGREQASALAASLAGASFDAAYTSPLRRARETAEIVLRDRPVPLTPLPELRELCYGLWQGRGADRCGGALEWRWRTAPWTVRFPGGETLVEVEARVASALRRLRELHPRGRVLVSGHGHLNRVLLIHAMGWERERFWEIEQPNGECRILELNGAADDMQRGVGQYHGVGPACQDTVANRMFVLEEKK